MRALAATRSANVLSSRAFQTISSRAFQTSLQQNTSLPGLEVIHDFVSEAESDALLTLADRFLDELPYEQEHYDNYISGYRECDVHVIEDAHAAEAVRRVRAKAWSITEGAWRRGFSLYPHAQLIDLLPEGRIAAHRDNFKIFGEFTAGLNLLSNAIVRFRPYCADDAPAAEKAHPEVIDALLLPRTLYVMHDVMRWEWTHEVLDCAATTNAWPPAARAKAPPAGEHAHDVQAQGGRSSSAVIRGRRISVIVRDMGQAGFLGTDGLW